MYVIGICGGSASGKSTLINDLLKKIKQDNLSVIKQDDYYKALHNTSAQERALMNFDHPNAIDFKLLNKHVSLLKNNIPINSPNYCFSSHNRKTSTTQVTPKKILIIDGILIFNDIDLFKLIDYKVYVDTPEKIRLERRIKRDQLERGRTKSSIINQFNTFVKPMHDKFVEIHKESSHLIIDGNLDFNNHIDILKSIINHQL